MNIQKAEVKFNAEYKLKCTDCGKIFSVLSSPNVWDVRRCPRCTASEIRRFNHGTPTQIIRPRTHNF